ncbi:MAG: TRAP transporter large permease subunit [Proteobacteria bacterium]|nr:TRAP transporter large permease subunit [Pseudomonadota bacterium]
MFAGLHVGTVLFLVGWIGDAVQAQVLPSMIGNLAWTTMNEFLLVAVPLFILLGEILLRSGIADRMYGVLAEWLRWLPGGLLHTNVVACALFAATTGSSVATAATIGTVGMPALQERGYNERLVLGSLAAGGTLGILIPPSISMIIYGALTGASVGRLFVAGIIPGIVLTATMVVIIAITSIWLPDPEDRRQPAKPLLERLRGTLDLAPVFFIFIVIMGSIYFGLATPTEAAALGVVGALLIAAGHRRLTVSMLHEAFLSTLRTTAMVLLVIVAAFSLNFILGFLGIPQSIANWVAGLGLSAYQTIWMLLVFYLILGCFLEVVSMMVTTIGIVVPLVVHLGFDPVWFGIFFTILAELAMITPPVGLNLYVVQSIRTSSGSIYDVFIGTLPFAGAMLLVLVLLIYVPEVALWLPDKMFE